MRLPPAAPAALAAMAATRSRSARHPLAARLAGVGRAPRGRGPAACTFSRSPRVPPPLHRSARWNLTGGLLAAAGLVALFLGLPAPV